jgi:transposase
MNFAGIDIASETHVLALVSSEGEIRVRPTPFGEDAPGYTLLFERLGPPEEVVVAMEATGHYWKNLFAALSTRGFAVALVNPLRTRRFADEDLQRTKTDAIDALGIARFAAQKRPPITRLPDAATEELRELVRLRDRIVAEIGDRVRQLHRLVDLGFPEFTRSVRTLDSQLALALLRQYPTAQAFARIAPARLSKLVYDGRHRVGPELARSLVETARRSVGAQHGTAYRVQVKYLCEDLTTLHGRLRELDADLERHLDNHEVGTLLTSIDGIGTLTAARLVAELGDPAEFASAAALASYVGVIPALRQSGKGRTRTALTAVGHRRLRQALWMPTLTAVRRNPWLPCGSCSSPSMPSRPVVSPSSLTSQARLERDQTPCSTSGYLRPASPPGARSAPRSGDDS